MCLIRRPRTENLWPHALTPGPEVQQEWMPQKKPLVLQYVFSLGRPEPHVDRGPLDDVVEQIRGQPELEEGEMGSSAHLYKPSRSYTGNQCYLLYI